MVLQIHSLICSFSLNSSKLIIRLYKYVSFQEINHLTLKVSTLHSEVLDYNWLSNLLVANLRFKVSRDRCALFKYLLYTFTFNLYLEVLDTIINAREMKTVLQCQTAHIPFCIMELKHPNEVTIRTLF